MPKKNITEKLPLEIIQEILWRCSKKGVLNFALTSHKALFFSQRNLEQIWAQKLLTHVVKGEKEAARRILNTNPGLLLIPSQAEDYSGRIIKGTVFQALPDDVDMWKMLESFFNKLSNEQKERARQFNKEFPNGLSDPKSYNFSTLAQAISESSEPDIQAARRKEQNETPLCKVLNIFRQEFTDCCRNNSSNLQHLLQINEIYKTRFDSWSWEQRDLFWRQGIGFVLRYCTARTAQVLSQGLYDVVEINNGACHRSFVLQNDTLCSFFPLKEASGLGFDYAIQGAASGERFAGKVEVDRGLSRKVLYGVLGEYPFLKKYVHSIQTELECLKQRVYGDVQPVADSLKSHSWCTIS